MVTLLSVTGSGTRPENRVTGHSTPWRNDTFSRHQDVAQAVDSRVTSLPATDEGAQRRLRCHRPIANRRAGDPGTWGESATAVGATSAPNPSANPVGGRRKGTL